MHTRSMTVADPVVGDNRSPVSLRSEVRHERGIFPNRRSPYPAGLVGSPLWSISTPHQDATTKHAVWSQKGHIAELGGMPKCHHY